MKRSELSELSSADKQQNMKRSVRKNMKRSELSELWSADKRKKYETLYAEKYEALWAVWTMKCWQTKKRWSALVEKIWSAVSWANYEVLTDKKNVKRSMWMNSKCSEVSVQFTKKKCPQAKKNVKCSRCLTKGEVKCCMKCLHAKKNVKCSG